MPLLEFLHLKKIVNSLSIRGKEAIFFASFRKCLLEKGEVLYVLSFVSIELRCNGGNERRTARPPDDVLTVEEEKSKGEGIGNLASADF